MASGTLCTEYTCSCSGCFTGMYCEESKNVFHPIFMYYTMRKFSVMRWCVCVCAPVNSVNWEKICVYMGTSTISFRIRTIQSEPSLVPGVE